MDQPKNTEEKELERASPLTRTMLESDVIYLKRLVIRNRHSRA